jgi:hypothetical protein
MKLLLGARETASANAFATVPNWPLYYYIVCDDELNNVPYTALLAHGATLG